MAMLTKLGCEDLISERVKNGATHQKIAAELQQLYGCAGMSARSVRRFCFDKNSHRSSQLNMHAVDDVVEQAVAQVITL